MTATARWLCAAILAVLAMGAAAPAVMAQTPQQLEIFRNLSPEQQQQVLNVMGHVVYGFTEESGLYELRKILRAVQSRKNPLPTPMGAWRILRYSSDIFRMVFGQVLARRRFSPRVARCYLDIECEQMPSRDSSDAIVAA